MFEKYDKRRLYWLMEQYLLNKISARVFCDVFYYCYDLELSPDALNDQEQKAFAELSIVANRFSEFKEDHENYPSTYFTENDLREKIMQTRKKFKI
jgi:hypothetical protein